MEQVREFVLQHIKSSSTCIHCFAKFYHKLILKTGCSQLLDPIYLVQIHILCSGYKRFFDVTFKDKEITFELYEIGRTVVARTMIDFCVHFGIPFNNIMWLLIHIIYDLMNSHFLACPHILNVQSVYCF